MLDVWDILLFSLSSSDFVSIRMAARDRPGVSEDRPLASWGETKTYILSTELPEDSRHAAEVNRLRPRMPDSPRLLSQKKLSRERSNSGAEQRLVFFKNAAHATRCPEGDCNVRRSSTAERPRAASARRAFCSQILGWGKVGIQN